MCYNATYVYSGTSVYVKDMLGQVILSIIVICREVSCREVRNLLSSTIRKVNSWCSKYLVVCSCLFGLSFVMAGSIIVTN